MSASTPMLSKQEEVISYKHAMFAKFNRDFTRLATSLRQVTIEDDLPVLPEGPANRPDPGPMPALAPGANADARAVWKDQVDAWKFISQLYNQFLEDSIGVCGLI